MDALWRAIGRRRAWRLAVVALVVVAALAPTVVAEAELLAARGLGALNALRPLSPTSPIPAGRGGRPVVWYENNRKLYALDETVEIYCWAWDADPGLKSTTCRDAVGPAYTFGYGLVRLQALAIDLGGARGYGQTSFRVRATVGSLCNLTRQFSTDAAVAERLCTSLGDGAEMTTARARHVRNVQAYVRGVTAQRNRAFTFQQVRQLTLWARGLF